MVAQPKPMPFGLEYVIDFDTPTGASARRSSQGQGKKVVASV